MAAQIIKICRFSFRVFFVAFLLFAAALTVLLSWWIASQKQRDWLLKNWSRLVIWVTGIEFERHGEPVLDQSVMWVSNHVSWLDVFCMNATRATVFIAKSEIRSWPLIGWMVASVGTVFIERQNRRGLVDISTRMQEMFQENCCVGLFPEGTTSDGSDMLKVYSSLLTPALITGVLIQPVALVYRHRGQRSGRVAFVGDQSLIANLWFLLNESGGSVTLYFLEPLKPEEGSELHDKTALAEYIREQIRGKLLA